MLQRIPFSLRDGLMKEECSAFRSFASSTPDIILLSPSLRLGEVSSFKLQSRRRRQNSEIWRQHSNNRLQISMNTETQQCPGNATAGHARARHPHTLSAPSHCISSLSLSLRES
jgi:hypothetical protein